MSGMMIPGRPATQFLDAFPPSTLRKNGRFNHTFWQCVFCRQNRIFTWCLSLKKWSFWQPSNSSTNLAVFRHIMTLCWRYICVSRVFSKAFVNRFVSFFRKNVKKGQGFTEKIAQNIKNIGFYPDMSKKRLGTRCENRPQILRETVKILRKSLLNSIKWRVLSMVVRHFLIIMLVQKRPCIDGNMHR